MRKKATAALPKHVPAGTGAAYWGPGELMTFLITGKETGGALFMAEISVAPGGGTPPHIHHREDESFHMLEGRLTIQVGGDTITASAGDFVFLPRGIAHSFKNTGDVREGAGPNSLRRALRVFLRKCSSLLPIVPRRRRLPSKELIGRALAAAPGTDLSFFPRA